MYEEVEKEVQRPFNRTENIFFTAAKVLKVRREENAVMRFYVVCFFVFYGLYLCRNSLNLKCSYDKKICSNMTFLANAKLYKSMLQADRLQTRREIEKQLSFFKKALALIYDYCPMLNGSFAIELTLYMLNFQETLNDFYSKKYTDNKFIEIFNEMGRDFSDMLSCISAEIEKQNEFYKMKSKIIDNIIDIFPIALAFFGLLK